MEEPSSSSLGKRPGRPSSTGARRAGSLLCSAGECLALSLELHLDGAKRGTAARRLISPEDCE